MFKSIVLAVGLTVASAAANAATLVAFPGVNGASVSGDVFAPGVTQIDLTRGSGVVQNSGSTFNSRGWNDAIDRASAIANNNFLTWGLNIAASNPFNLTDMVFDYDRSGTGPVAMVIDMFIDGIFQAEVFRDLAVDNSASQFETADLSPFTGVTGAVTFRLAAWGATSGLGTFDIENNDLMFNNTNYGILVKGDAVAPVPLPAGLPLLAAAGLALGFVGRRRQRA